MYTDLIHLIQSRTRGNPPTTKRNQMLVKSKLDTWGALTQVQSVLKEMVYRDLGNQLSDSEFEQIDSILSQITAILEVI